MSNQSELAFKDTYNQAIGERATIITRHVYSLCKLDKRSEPKLTAEEAECVTNSSHKLWAFFKTADAQLGNSFFE